MKRRHRVADEEGEAVSNSRVPAAVRSLFRSGTPPCPLHPEREGNGADHVMLVAERGQTRMVVSGRIFGHTHPRDWRHIRQMMYDVKRDVKMTLKIVNLNGFCRNLCKHHSGCCRGHGGLAHRVELCSVWSVGGITPMRWWWRPPRPRACLYGVDPVLEGSFRHSASERSWPWKRPR